MLLSDDGGVTHQGCHAGERVNASCSLDSRQPEEEQSGNDSKESVELEMEDQPGVHICKW